MLKGLITIKDIEKAVKYPNSARDKDGRLLCAAAIGATADVLERAGELVKAQVDALVLDSAHGHSQNILGAVSKVKAAFPDVSLIAGNIATADAAAALIEAGADAIKVGDRPRLHLYHTGGGGHRGTPQITAIYDAACMASKYGVPVIADGGIKYSGDIVKAVAAGGQRHHDPGLWWPGARNPRGHRDLSGTPVQGVPGMPRCHVSRQQGPVFPGG